MNERIFKYHSMPVHNPLYEIERVSFRGDIVKADLIIKKPEEIANIIPEPLIYKDNKIFIVLIMVTELKEGFSEEDTLWNEIAIQIPVIHNNESGIYICENYSNSIRGILSSREIYGYPKVPGQISIDKKGNDFEAKLFKYGSNKEILNFTYKLLNKESNPIGPSQSRIIKKMPKIILLKYIPSATLSNKPDVKQLVTMKYKKPVIHKQLFGDGIIELSESAPNYLKEAGITNIVHISYSDMEMNLIGGEILHNYIS